jgi:hypothetical protein
MASTNPSRIVQVWDVTLDEYDGNLSDMLRGILQECRCETHIPVKKHPHATAEHMDRCRHLLSMFYHMHKALVSEIQSLVEEITESTPTPWCTGETSRPP